MLNQKDKFERFAAVINRDAAEQCRFIEKHTKQLEEKQLAEIEKEVRQELEASMNLEIQKIREEINCEISCAKAKSRRNRIVHREEICSKVFLLAREKVEEFVKSEEYGDFLKRSLLAFRDNVSENCTVFARKEDLQLVEALLQEMKWNAKVCVDTENTFGGISAENAEGTVRLDDTLLTRLEAQKECFRQNSLITII